MRAIDRKLVRDLGLLKGQVATIAVVVACGIAAYVTMRSAWSSLTWSRDTYYERYRFADVFAHLERAPDAVADRIEAVDGVAVVYPRVVEDVLLPIPGEPEPATGRLVSIPEHGQPPLNALYIRTGRLPEAGRTDEVVVLEAFANAHALKPGDAIPAVINGALRELRVVGVALSPEYVFAARPGELAPDDRRFAILWMHRRVLGAAFEMEGAFNDVALRLQPGASEDEVLTRLDDILEPYGGLGAVGRDHQASNFYIEGELSQLEQFATVIPFIFLAVAAFLLNVVLSRLVGLQRTQIAVLKALGYSNWQVGRHYLALMMIIVSIGAVLGIGLGAWLGKGMTGLYAGFFRFPVLAYRLEPAVAAVGVLVSAVAAIAGGLITIRQVVKLPPAEAMRPPSPPRYRVSIVERLALSRLFGTSAMMVFRELRRRPLRAILSSLGIAAAIGILVVGRFSYDSFDYLLHGPLAAQQRGDMTVQFLRPVPERAARELAHLPGVIAAEGTRVVPVRFVAGHLERDSAIQTVGEPPLLRHVVDRRGNEIAIEGGLALSRILAERLDVEPGEPVTVEILEGQRQVLSIPVTQLVDDAFGMQGYMTLRQLHRMLGAEVSVTAVDLRIDRGASDEIHRRLQQYPNVALITRTGDLVERFEEQTGEMMWIMTLILATFAASIAIGVVYNNARVALSMRQRDLASLRVLGFHRREISAVLLGELAVHMILAIPIGLLLGTWWARAVMATVDPESFRLPVVISSQSYAFAALVATGAGLVSALLVRRKLDRLDLIAVLKTRE